MGVKPSSPTRGKRNLGLPVPPDAALPRLRGVGAQIIYYIGVRGFTRRNGLAAPARWHLGSDLGLGCAKGVCERVPGSEFDRAGYSGLASSGPAWAKAFYPPDYADGGGPV